MNLSSELGRTDLILKTTHHKIPQILHFNVELAVRWKQTSLIPGHLWFLSAISMNTKIIIEKKMEKED